jgi:hypothetical protein
MEGNGWAIGTHIHPHKLVFRMHEAQEEDGENPLVIVEYCVRIVWSLYGDVLSIDGPPLPFLCLSITL